MFTIASSIPVSCGQDGHILDFEPSHHSFGESSGDNCGLNPHEKGCFFSCRGRAKTFKISFGIMASFPPAVELLYQQCVANSGLLCQCSNLS